MQTFTSRLILTILFVLSAFQFTAAQLYLQGNSYLEYAVDRETDENYFEDWTDLSLRYQNWRLGARYEFHLPPQVYSQDSTGQGVSQRFLEYRKQNLTVTLGNFYALLGRGLVLRAFDNRMLRWDTNIDGAKFEYYHDKFDLKVLGGRMRDRRGRRHSVMQGGSLRLKPVYLFDIGGTFLTRRLETSERVYWGSGFATVNSDWGSLYFERAFKNYPDRFAKGKAYYLSGNFFWDAFTALVEYRYYEHFNLTETLVSKNPPSELTFNNPPSVVREHLYMLMNRHQHVMNANDEKGYLVELTYSVGEAGVLTLNHSRTRSLRPSVGELYREYYGQFEYDPSSSLGLVAGAGEQKDAEARYLNFVGTMKLGLSTYNSLKAIFEHQHVKILLTDRQFYNQALSLSFDRTPYFTVSLLTERTTEQFSEQDFWVGGQLDVHFLENFDLSIFGGERREGKVCLGGVCIYRPEFEGVELRLINRF